MFAVEQLAGFWGFLVTFLNSPVGAGLLITVLAVIIGKVVTSPKKWEKAFDQYRGYFFDAVKFAENSIPDDLPKGSAASKADAALKYILEISENPRFKQLRNLSEDALRKAIDKAHAEKTKQLQSIQKNPQKEK